MKDVIHGYRYRVDWRGRLVLQVLAEDVTGPVTVSYSEFTYGRWRDAGTEDITRSANPPHKTITSEKS